MSAFSGKASKGGGKFVAVPGGPHEARCVAVIDLGTHEESYQGKNPKDTRKVALVFEIMDVQGDDGKNAFMAANFALFFSEKAKLRLFLEGYAGRKFNDGEDIDPSKLLGAACIANVEETEKNGKTYAALSRITKPMPKQTIDKPTVTPFTFVVGTEDEIPDQEWLPFLYGQSIGDVIRVSKEMTGEATVAQKAARSAGMQTKQQHQTVAAQDMSSDAPF